MKKRKSHHSLWLPVNRNDDACLRICYRTLKPPWCCHLDLQMRLSSHRVLSDKPPKQLMNCTIDSMVFLPSPMVYVLLSPEDSGATAEFCLSCCVQMWLRLW